MRQRLTLAALSEQTGVPARTIRSWVADQLVPGPLSRGRGATYPAVCLERVRRVREMKEAGLSTDEIRRKGWFDDDLATYAAARLEIPRPRVRSEIENLSTVEIPAFRGAFHTLAKRLQAGTEYDPGAGARVSDWVSFEVSPDVELNVRGPLTEEQRALIARCATAIGKVLANDY